MRYSSINYSVWSGGYVLKLRSSGDDTLNREVEHGKGLKKSSTVVLPLFQQLMAFLISILLKRKVHPFIEKRTLHSSALTKTALRSTAQVSRAIHSIRAEEGLAWISVPPLTGEAERGKGEKGIREICFHLLRIKGMLTPELSSEEFETVFVQRRRLHGEDLLFNKDEQVCWVLDLVMKCGSFPRRVFQRGGWALFEDQPSFFTLSQGIEGVVKFFLEGIELLQRWIALED